MVLTLREMLNTAEYRDFKIIAGEKGLDKEVSNINVVDVPDIASWIKGGELLITTAYFVKEDPLKLIELIQEVKIAGATGLGIKIKRYIDVIPQEVLEKAEELDFPLLIIPQDKAFVDIINNVLTSIVNKQAEKLMLSEKIHKAFTQLVIDGGEVREIIITLERILDTDIAYVDTYFNEKKIYTSSERLKSTIESVLPEEVCDLENHQCYPITIKDVFYGVLVIDEMRILKEDLDMLELAIEHASTVLKLDIQMKISNRQIETRYRDLLAQDLLFNNVKSIEEVHKRTMSLYNFELDTVCVCVVDIDDYKQTYVKAQNEQEVSYLEQKIRNLFFIARTQLANHYNKIMYTTFSDSIVFILEADNEDNLHYRAKEIKDLIEQQSIFTVTIGISEKKDSLLKTYEAYKEARTAIELSREVYKRNKAVLYSSLGAYKLLASVGDSEIVTEFISKYIVPIKKYDHKRNQELYYTLLKIVQNDWNLTTAAKDLFIHYNTLKYRYDRIAKILSVDLTSTETKLNIALAIKLEQIRK